MIEAGRVIQALAGLRAPPSGWASARALQTAIESRLRELGVKVMRRRVDKRGQGELVVDSAPNLLLEISCSGEATRVSEAAAQLCIHRKGLPLAGAVMVLGSPPQHAALRSALAALHITVVECG